MTDQRDQQRKPDVGVMPGGDERDDQQHLEQGVAGIQNRRREIPPLCGWMMPGRLGQVWVDDNGFVESASEQGAGVDVVTAIRTKSVGVYITADYLGRVR